MCENFDRYHRWEALAEFHFCIDENNSDGNGMFEEEDSNYVYCLCSRVFIRDSVQTYYADKEDASESDVEIIRGTQSQEVDDHSHVHFSLDTSYKVKCEKDEGASCYCSASHTDNYYSTDEHDPAQMPTTISHALQPSDSGADLTYPDCHSDNTNEKLDRMEQEETANSENYFSEDTWEKFWAINGERLIWASWIKKYSDYINPGYLDQNNDLIIDDSNIPKLQLVEQFSQESDTKKIVGHANIRERKFSYDSKVNPYKKNVTNENITDRNSKNNSFNKDDCWLNIGRRRSCSEHDRMVSPRTLAGTDSMTNVTKLTFSSYEVSSSHVTSESSPTDDYSVESSTSDDHSNDQTRIANLEETIDQVLSEDLDTEQYWQLLWKKHFGEQYALHYSNYIQIHTEKPNGLSSINVVAAEDKFKEKLLDIEHENSESCSQEMPSLIEVNLSEVKGEECKPKKLNEKESFQYLQPVHVENESKFQKCDEKESADVKDESKVQKLDEKECTEYLLSEPVALKIESKSQKLDKKEPADVKDESKLQTLDEKECTGWTELSQPVNLKNESKTQKLNEKDFTKCAQPIKIKEEGGKPNKKNKKDSIKYLQSVGVLLQTLLKEERNKEELEEINEAGDTEPDKTASVLENTVDKVDTDLSNVQQVTSNTTLISCSLNDGDDEPPEDKPIELERSHLSDDEEVEYEKIKSTFQIMGFCMSPENMPKGQVVYRKRLARLRPPRNRRFVGRKTYFDDDGNPQPESQEEREVSELIPEEQCPETKIDNEPQSNIVSETGDDVNADFNVKEAVDGENNEDRNSDIALEASETPFPLDEDNDDSFSDSRDNVDVKISKVERDKNKTDLNKSESKSVESTKRKRRPPKRSRNEAFDTETLDMPEELKNDPKMFKYWKRRHSLFHRFDEGVRLDRESWFSVTPESVARHVAGKVAYDTVLDAFCGAGGNTIQFARVCKKVIAIDIDPVKVEMARHNAQVYGVAERVHFVVGDFFALAPTLSADMVFLSPPWGGPAYSENHQYDLETMLEPKPASELMRVARTISPNITLYLPRNSKCDQILSLAKEVCGSVELEQNYLDRRFVAITAYYY